MISVIASPVFRLDGPGGSRSRENCALADAQAIKISNGRAWNFTKETILIIMQVPGMTTAIRQGYIRATLSPSGQRPEACGIAAARAQLGQEKAPAQERRGTFSRYHDSSPNASSAVVWKMTESSFYLRHHAINLTRTKLSALYRRTP